MKKLVLSTRHTALSTTMDELALRLKIKTDLICVLILCDKISDETILGERKLVRQWCQKFLPEKMDRYDRIYEARFDRLIAQFR